MLVCWCSGGVVAHGVAADNVVGACCGPGVGDWWLMRLEDEIPLLTKPV